MLSANALPFSAVLLAMLAVVGSTAATEHMLRPRRRLAAASWSEGVPVFGNVSRFGYYYADVQLGRPAQASTVIIDTGSSMMVVPCASCDNCGRHIQPPYSPAQSSTSAPCGSRSGDCSFAIGYSEGSKLEGDRVKDGVCVGSSCSPSKDGVRYAFGCARVMTALFASQAADGILGLSPASGTLMSALTAAHKVDQDLLSFCLHRQGGSMSLGSFNSSRLRSPLQWAHMSQQSYYKVAISSVSVGEHAVSSFAATEAVIDTGTTFTALPAAQQAAVASALKAACPEQSNCSMLPPGHGRLDGSIGCWRLPHGLRNVSARLPTVSLQLGGAVTLRVSPEDYLEQHPFLPDVWCFILWGDVSEALLGANFMRSHMVVLDRAGSRIGVAAADCPWSVDASQAVQQQPPPLLYPQSLLAQVLFMSAFCILLLLACRSAALRLHRDPYRPLRSRAGDAEAADDVHAAAADLELIAVEQGDEEVDGEEEASEEEEGGGQPSSSVFEVAI